jgi:hypothetical protein
MNTTTMTRAILVVSIMFVLTSVSPQLAARESPFSFGHRVAGSFLVDLELTGSAGTPFPVQALATLAADGGAVATDTDDFGFGTGGFYHSPKQGAWKRIGKHSISITVLEFAYDTLGNLTMVFKLNFVADFDDRRFDSGGGAVAFDAFLPGQDPLDPDTIPVASGGGEFAFRRISP